MIRKSCSISFPCLGLFLLFSCGGSGSGNSGGEQNLSWTHPTSLSSSAISISGEQATYPRVAISDDGESVIAFLQRVGGENQLFFSQYNEEKWTHPDEQSDAISKEQASDHQVAMDKEGNALIVWRQWNGTHFMIYKSEYRSGSWSHPSDLNDHISIAGQNCELPAVAMDDAGNAVIVWIQNEGNTGRLFKSEYRSSSWTHPTKTSENIAVDASQVEKVFVSMASGDSSSTVVAWEQANGIYISDYRDGSWNHPELAEDRVSPTGTEVELRDVSVSAGGHAVVAWTQANSVGFEGVYLSEYRGGAWNHPEDLADFQIALNESVVADLSTAINDSGNTLMAWIQSNGSLNQVFFGEYADGKWSYPESQQKHISPEGEVASYLDVGINSKNEALIVWQQYNAVENTVLMSQKTDSTWDHPEDVFDNISIDGQSALSPRVALSENSEALVSWYQYDGAEFRIYHSYYR